VGYRLRDFRPLRCAAAQPSPHPLPYKPVGVVVRHLLTAVCFPFDTLRRGCHTGEAVGDEIRLLPVHRRSLRVSCLPHAPSEYELSTGVTSHATHTLTFVSMMRMLRDDPAAILHTARCATLRHNARFKRGNGPFLAGSALNREPQLVPRCDMLHAGCVDAPAADGAPGTVHRASRRRQEAEIGSGNVRQAARRTGATHPLFPPLHRTLPAHTVRREVACTSRREATRSRAFGVA
jgi:hypothetical protein